MLIDMHCHSTLSDGTLTIEELVAAAERRCYRALAITDHAVGHDPSYRDVVSAVRAEVDRLRAQTEILLFSGVEITDFPPDRIAAVAAEARRCGAEVVVVHGECVSASVFPGTNAAAVRCSDVDVLGHPGLISEQDADEAARRGVFLELSARQGHCWGNGHVRSTACRTGAPLIVDSDGHDESGLLSTARVEAIIRGAGASSVGVHHIVEQLAPALINRIQRRVHAAL